MLSPCSRPPAPTPTPPPPAAAWYPRYVGGQYLEGLLHPSADPHNCLVCSIGPTASTLLFLYSINPAIPIVHGLSIKYQLGDGKGAAPPSPGHPLHSPHTTYLTRKLEELKMKKGAENLRRATSGMHRTMKTDAANKIKEASEKLIELQNDLDEVEAQILLTKGQTQSMAPQQEDTPAAIDPPMSPSIGDESLEQQPESWNPRESSLKNLENRGVVSAKPRGGGGSCPPPCRTPFFSRTIMKLGAENILTSIGASRPNKKLHYQAQNMLSESRAKIEYLRMAINKQRLNGPSASSGGWG